MAFEEGDGSYKDTARYESHESDRMAIGGLGLWWGCGGVVLTLGAALRMGGQGTCERRGEESACDERSSRRCAAGFAYGMGRKAGFSTTLRSGRNDMFFQRCAPAEMTRFSESVGGQVIGRRREE